MSGKPVQRRTESKFAQSTGTQRDQAEKAGDSAHQASSGEAYRVDF